MRLLVYVGSPRIEGNTYKLSKILKSQLDDKKIEGDFVYAPKVLNPCRHCGVCAIGECVIKDEWSTYVTNFKKYDGVIFMTPIYFFQFTAQTKAFIDRLGGSSNWKDKILALITSSGSADRMGGNDLLEESIIRTCEYHECYYAGCYNKVTNDLILDPTDEDYKGIYNVVENMEEIYSEIQKA